MLFEDNTGIFKDIRFWMLIIALLLLIILVANSYIASI